MMLKHNEVNQKSQFNTKIIYIQMKCQSIKLKNKSININNKMIILALSIVVPISAGAGKLRSRSFKGGLNFSASFSSRVTPSALGNREFHFALYLLAFTACKHKHFSKVLVSIRLCERIKPISHELCYTDPGDKYGKSKSKYGLGFFIFG